MGRAHARVNITQPSGLVVRPALQKIPLSARAVVILAAAGLAACVASVDQRGNLPEPEKIAQIRPGRTTRDQVAKILGTPSSTGIFDDKRWYYISRKTQQVAFLDPDVLDQQVYIVNFDAKGVVQAVDHKELKDGREIEPAAGATPAPGRELTLVEQVLGNIGRFNKSSKSEGGSEGGARPGPRPNDTNK